MLKLPDISFLTPDAQQDFLAAWNAPWTGFSARQESDLTPEEILVSAQATACTNTLGTGTQVGTYRKLCVNVPANNGVWDGQGYHEERSLGWLIGATRIMVLLSTGNPNPQSGEWYEYNSELNFPWIPLPSNAVINYAKLRAQSTGYGGAGSVSVVIRAEPVPYPSMCTHHLEAYARPRTDEYVPWAFEPDYPDGTWAETPDISCVIQSLIGIDRWVFEGEYDYNTFSLEGVFTAPSPCFWELSHYVDEFVDAWDLNIYDSSQKNVHYAQFQGLQQGVAKTSTDLGYGQPTLTAMFRTEHDSGALTLHQNFVPDSIHLFIDEAIPTYGGTIDSNSAQQFKPSVTELELWYSFKYEEIVEGGVRLGGSAVLGGENQTARFRRGTQFIRLLMRMNDTNVSSNVRFSELYMPASARTGAFAGTTAFYRLINSLSTSGGVRLGGSSPVFREYSNFGTSGVRVGASGDLFASYKPVIQRNRNILDYYTTWTEGIGSVTGFGQNGGDLENVRFRDTGPFGYEEMVWEARPDEISDADGGWQTSFFPIDNTKMYRFSVWVNRTVQGNGSFYFGTRSYQTSVGYITLKRKYDGIETTNPYFWSGSVPTTVGEWTLWVGFVWPVGTELGGNHPDTGKWTIAGGKTVSTGNDWIWLPESDYTAHRTYLYYSTDTSTRQRWVRPRVDIVDGNEPTIQELLDDFSIEGPGVFSSGKTNFIEVAEANGTVEANGAAKSTMISSNRSSGGIRIGGSGATKVNYRIAASSGTKLNGSSPLVLNGSVGAAGGIKVSGSTTSYVLYRASTSGGTTANFQNAVGTSAAFVSADKSYLKTASNFAVGDIDLEVGVWVNASRNDAGTQNIIGVNRTDSSADSAFAVRLVNNQFRFYVWGSVASSWVYETSTAISANTWYFVKAWHSASLNKIYIQVNGGTIFEADHAGGLNVGTVPLTIGASAIGTLYFGGSIAGAYVRTQISTPEESGLLYNNGQMRPWSHWSPSLRQGVAGHWGLQDGPWSSSHTAVDDSINGNDLSPDFAAIIDETNLNGSFETLGAGGADVFASWSEQLSVDIGNSINEETSVVYSGSRACRIDCGSVGGVAKVRQYVLQLNKNYDVQFYARSLTTVGSPTIRVRTAWGSYFPSLSTTYTFYSFTMNSGAGNWFELGVDGTHALNNSMYIDQVSLSCAEISRAIGPITTTVMPTESAKYSIVTTSGTAIGGSATVKTVYLSSVSSGIITDSASTSKSAAANLIAADKAWFGRATATCVGLDPGTASFSFSTHVKMNSYTTARMLFNKGVQNLTSPGYSLYVDTNGKPRAQMCDGSGNIITTPFGPTVLGTTQWRHILVTVNRTGLMTLYIDGVYETSVDVSSQQGNVTSGSNFGIGSYGWGQSWHDGLQAFSRFWSRALSPEEVARQANVVGGVTQAVHYRHLTESERTGMVSSWDEPPNHADVNNPWIDLHGENDLTTFFGPIINATYGNGGFESWTSETVPEVWGTAGTVTRESSQVYTGAYSAAYSTRFEGRACGVYKFMLSPDKRYSYTFYAKGPAVPSRIRCGDDNQGATSNYHDLTASWSPYAGEFKSQTIGAGAVILYKYDTDEIAYVDALTLQAAEIKSADGPLATVLSVESAKYNPSTANGVRLNGSAAESYVNTPLTFNESGSGGVKVNGAAVESYTNVTITFSEIASGGIRTNGQSAPRVTYPITIVGLGLVANRESIVQNGLFLHFDAKNPNSFRGEPTTNLAGNPTTISTQWNNSGTATWNANDAAVPRLFPDVAVMSMQKDTDGNSHIGLASTAITTSTTYTVSIYVWIPSSNSAAMLGSIPYIRPQPDNQNRGNLMYEGSVVWGNWPRDQWIRISNTFTSPSTNVTSMYISCYLNTAGDKVYFTAPQIEQLDHLTHYTTSSRGATVASGGGWADLSANSNHGQLTNGVRYDSANGGNLVFDGSNDYIHVVSPSDRFAWTPSGAGNNTLCLELWVKSTDPTGCYISKPWNGSGEYNYKLSHNRFDLRVGSQETNVNLPSSFALGSWQHIVVIFNSTQIGVYRNGVLEVPFANHNITNNVPTYGNINAPLAIMTLYPYGEGTWDYTTHAIQGNVATCRVYTSELSADEVAQNYNQQKDRFYAVCDETTVAITYSPGTQSGTRIGGQSQQKTIANVSTSGGTRVGGSASETFTNNTFTHNEIASGGVRVNSAIIPYLKYNISTSGGGQLSGSQITATNFKYWTNGGGDNLWNNSANWGYNSTGTAESAGVPGVADRVFLTSSIIDNCTIDTDVEVKEIRCTGYTGTFSAGTYNVIVHGNVTLTGVVVIATSHWTVNNGIINYSGVTSQSYVNGSSLTVNGVCSVNMKSDTGWGLLVINPDATLTTVSGGNGQFGYGIDIGGNLIINGLIYTQFYFYFRSTGSLSGSGSLWNTNASDGMVAALEPGFTFGGNIQLDVKAGTQTNVIPPWDYSTVNSFRIKCDYARTATLQLAAGTYSFSNLYFSTNHASANLTFDCATNAPTINATSFSQTQASGVCTLSSGGTWNVGNYTINSGTLNLGNTTLNVSNGTLDVRGVTGPTTSNFHGTSTINFLGVSTVRTISGFTYLYNVNIPEGSTLTCATGECYCRGVLNIYGTVNGSGYFGSGQTGDMYVYGTANISGMILTAYSTFAGHGFLYRDLAATITSKLFTYSVQTTVALPPGSYGEFQTYAHGASGEVVFEGEYTFATNFQIVTNTLTTYDSKVRFNNATINCINVSFWFGTSTTTNMVVTNSGNTNWNIAGSVSRSGTGTGLLQWTPGNGTIKFTGSSAQNIDFDYCVPGYEEIDNVLIDKSSSTATLTGNLKAKSFVVKKGTLVPNAKTITTSGDVQIFSSAQIGSGLDGSTWNVGGNFFAQGEPSDLLLLNPASAWTLNVAGDGWAEYARVANSNANGSSTPIIGSNGSIDEGSNSNWTFGQGIKVNGNAAMSVQRATTVSGGIRIAGLSNAKADYTPRPENDTLGASFVGSDKSYLRSETGAFSSITDNVTVSVFVRKDAFVSTCGIFTSENGWSTGLHMYVRNIAGQQIAWGLGGSAYARVGNFATGEWTHLCGTYSQTDGQGFLYINGVEAGSFNSTSAISMPGRYALGGLVDEYYNGQIAYFRIWDRVLTPSEIERQANVSNSTSHARPYALLSEGEKTGLVSALELQEDGINTTTRYDSHGTNHFDPYFVPIISPTVANGSFETAGTSTAFANWTNTATVTRETSVVYSGAAACALNVPLDNSGTWVVQSGVQTIGKKYSLGIYARCNDGDMTFPPSVKWENAGGGVAAEWTLTTSYALYSATARQTTTNFVLNRRNDAAGRTIYIDDATLSAAEILASSGPLSILVNPGGVENIGSVTATKATYATSGTSGIKLNSSVPGKGLYSITGTSGIKVSGISNIKKITSQTSTSGIRTNGSGLERAIYPIAAGRGGLVVDKESIVKNGLVLHFDAKSPDSFRGEPTVNQANTDFKRTIQFHNQGTYGNAGTIADAPEKGPGWKKITITNRGTNFRIAQFPYIIHSATVSKTYSVEFDATETSGYYWRLDGYTGYGRVDVQGAGRAIITMPPGNAASIAIFLNHDTVGVSGISDTIYYRYYQVEEKDHATPFTEDTRGETYDTGGGWADISGNANHGQLLNGLTFDSNNGGSLVFDGVNDYVPFDNPLDQNNLTQVWTVQAWVNITTKPSQQLIVGLNSGLYVEFMQGNNALLYLNSGDNDYYTYGYDGGFSDLGWKLATFRFDNSDGHRQIWRNLQIIGNAQGPNKTSTPSGQATQFTLGRNDANTISGRVATLYFYNRLLTDDEIAHNYHELQDRFYTPYDIADINVVSSLGGSSGVSVGGQPQEKITVNIQTGGGIKLGGQPTPSATYKLGSTSGTKIGGAADESFSDLIEISGGIRISGLTTPNCTFVPVIDYYRRSITIGHANIDDDLTDFPVLIRFNQDRGIAQHILDPIDATDIQFQDSTGNYLNYEKTSFSIDNNEASGSFWVKCDLSASQDTTIYLCYGKVLPGSTSATEVWTNYAHVYHLNEALSTVAGNYKDSTANARHGTLVDTDGNTTRATGQVDYGVNFPGVDQISLTNLSVSTNVGDRTTVSFWMNWDGTNGIMPFGFLTYDLFLLDHFFGFNVGNGDVWGISFPPATWANQFVHVSAEFLNGDAKLNRLFINGIEQSLSQKVSSTVSRNISINATISGWVNTTNYGFRGVLDEFRFSNGARSNAWIKFEYYNQYNDQLSIASEPSIGGFNANSAGSEAAVYNSSSSSGGITGGSGIGGRTLSESGSGGLLASGNGWVSHVNTLSAISGIKVSGTAWLRKIAKETATSGIKVSGVSSVNLLYKPIPTDGHGTKVSGESETKVEYNPVRLYNRNLLDDFPAWTEGTGNVTGYQVVESVPGENQRIISTNPFGYQEVIWQAQSSGDDSQDGGWNTPYFSPDVSKRYRLCVWAYRPVLGSGSGIAYLGTRAYSTGVLNGNTGVNSTNPWMFSTGAVADNNKMAAEWVLLVGHIHPVDTPIPVQHPDTGMWSRVNGKLVTSGTFSDWVWTAGVANSLHRTYYAAGNDNSTVIQQWARPRIDLCDGKEPSIQDLLNDFQTDTSGRFGGSSGVSHQFSEPTSSGIRLGGVSDESFTDLVEVTGGLRINGTANVKITYALNTSGVIKAAGDADTECVYQISTTSGIKTSGLSSPNSCYTPVYIDIRSGLIGEWKFEGDLIDTSENSNNGTLVGTPTYDTGRYGQSLLFNRDGYVSAPGGTYPCNGITLSAWVYLTGNNYCQNVFGTVGSPNNHFIMPMYPTNNWVYFYLRDDSGNSRSTKTTTCPKNQWVHIVETYDGSQMKIYFNGVEQVEATTNLSFNYTSINLSSLKVGERGDVSGDSFVGNIDEVRIYNRALTAQEVAYLSTLGSHGIKLSGESEINVEYNPVRLYNRNLLEAFPNWTEGVGSTPGFTAPLPACNIREYLEGPWGYQELIWNTQDLTGQSIQGGWGGYSGDGWVMTPGDLVSIDNTKLYRFSVWTKRVSGFDSGNFYLGINGANDENANIGVRYLGSDTVITNPYFWYANDESKRISISDWVLCVGHVFAYADVQSSQHPESGVYALDGTKFHVNLSDYRWLPENTKVRHRTFLTYPNPDVEHLWVRPRIDLCDGKEPTIQDLLNDFHTDTSGRFGGSSYISHQFSEPTSSGIRLGGASDESFTDLIEVTGGLQANGNARIAKIANSIQVAGGAILSGQSEIKASYKTTFTNGAVLGSTATNKLMGRWKFNGNAQDSSGYNNHGNVAGSPTYVSGQEGEAIQFSGDGGDYVNVPDNPSLNTKDTLTISLWFKPLGESQNYATHLVNKWTGINDANFALYYFGVPSGSVRAIRFYANRGGAWGDISGSFYVTLGEWVHIGLSYDVQLGGQLYINGSPWSVRRGGGQLATSTNYINFNVSTGDTSGGVLDDVRIYNAAFSDAEMATIASGGDVSTIRSLESFNYSIRSSSGVKTGGEAIVAKIANSIQVAGGVETNGVSNITAKYAVPTSSGIKLSGECEENLGDYVEIGGGLVVNGNARVAKIANSIIVSGGILANSQSRVDVAYRISTTSGVKSNGSIKTNPIYNLSSTSGTRVNGLIYPKLTYSIRTASGSKLGGIAFNTERHWEIGSGNIKINGVSDDSFNDYVEVGGFLIIAGDAIVAKSTNSVFASGGSIASGSHPIFVVYDGNQHFYNNLLLGYPWAEGSGTISGYYGAISGAEENVRFLTTGPFGYDEVVWEARPDAVSGPDGGWNSTTYPIDNTKMYRFSVWVNRKVQGNGYFYLGLYGVNSVYTNVGVYSRSDLTNNTNPYFYVSSAPGTEGEWTLVIGHVWPVGTGAGSTHPDSGRYTKTSGRIGDISTDYIWREDNARTIHRSYLYYSTDVNTRQQWVRPRIDLCDGNEPTIQELLNDIPDPILGEGVKEAGVSINSANYNPKTYQGWKKPIVISHANIDAPLTDFPLLVKISQDADIGSKTLDPINGSDIIFKDVNHNELPFEKTAFSITDGKATGTFWVKCDLSDIQDTTIYICYGDHSVIAQLPSDVWTNYSHVYHLNETTSTSSENYKDATINAKHGTLVDTDGNTARVTGQVDYAVDFPGGDQIQLDNLNVSTANGDKTTVSFWMTWDGTTNVMPFGFTNYDLYFGWTTWFGFNTSNSDIYGIGSASPSEWAGIPIHITAVFCNQDVTQNKLYVNGVSQTLSQLGTPLARTATTSAAICGWRSGTSYRMAGVMDEVRISNGSRSDAWVKFEYYNQSSGETSILTEQESTIGTSILNSQGAESFTGVLGMTGGLKSGGYAEENCTYNLRTTGGIKLNSKASEKVTYATTSTSGVKTNGQSSLNQAFNPASTSGTKTNGTAQVKANYTTLGTFGVKTNGNAQNTHYVSQTASAGIKVNGNSRLAFNDLVETTGGVKASGQGREYVKYSLSSTSGVRTNGYPDFHMAYQIACDSGLTVNGSAALNIRYTTTGTSGVKTGGLTQNSQYFWEIGKNGLKVNGTSDDSFFDFVEVTGGIKLNGRSLENAEYALSTTGGTKANGTFQLNPVYNLSTSGGVRTTGISYPDIAYNTLGTAGIRTNGNAQNTHYMHNDTSSGTKINGSFTVSFNDVAETTGGIRVNGLSSEKATYSTSSTSGIVLSGSILTRPVYNLSTSSGTKVNGLVYPEYTINVLGSQGVRTNGNAKDTHYAWEISTSGSIVNGTSDDSFFDFVEVTGGIRLSGVSAIQIRYRTLGQSGVRLNGSLVVKPTYNLRTSSGIKVGGLLYPKYTYNARGTSGVLCSGDAYDTHYTAQESSGGSISGGSSDETFNDIVEVGGNTQLNGELSVQGIYSLSTSGGIHTNGNANLEPIYNLTTSGGLKLNGTSYPRLSYKVFGTQGIKVGGLAPNNHRTWNITSSGVRINGVSDESFNDYVEITGGVRLNSNSVVGVIVNSLRTISGIKLAGNANENGRYFVQTQSGTRCNGNVLHVFSYNLYTSNGAKISGTSAPNATYKIASTSGVKINGLAIIKETVNVHGTSGIKISGQAKDNIQADEQAKNGVRVNGIAQFLLTHRTFTSSGSRVNGSGSLSIAYLHTITGLIVLNGSADESFADTYDVTGGLQIAGDSEINTRLNVATAAGVVNNGSSDVFALYAISSVSGATVSGSYIYNQMFQPSTTSGVLVLGTTREFETFIEQPSGGTTTDGLSDPKITCNPTVLSGSAIGGAALEGGMYNPNPFGVIILSGSGVVRITYLTISTAGVDTSGNAIANAKFNPEAFGGITVDGHAETFANYYLLAYPGTIIAGNAWLNRNSSEPTFGGIRLNGTTDFLFLYRTRGSSGIQLAGELWPGLTDYVENEFGFAVLGGHALAESPTYHFLATGEFVIESQSRIYARTWFYVYPDGDGITTDGVSPANPGRSYAGSGTIQIEGSATAGIKNYKVLTSGNILVGSQSEFNYSAKVAGGIQLGGVAELDRFVHAASGEIIVGSDIVLRATYRSSMTGSLILSSNNTILLQTPTAGSIRLGGTARLDDFRSVATGEIQIEGDYLLRITRKVVARGSLETSGNAVVILDLPASGGVKTSGRAILDQRIVIASGGITVESESLLKATYRYPASGYLVIDGDSISSLAEYSHQSSGELTLSGKAEAVLVRFEPDCETGIIRCFIHDPNNHTICPTVEVYLPEVDVLNLSADTIKGAILPAIIACRQRELPKMNIPTKRPTGRVEI